MATNEKEINNALFDQLTLIERIKKAWEKNGEAAAKEMMDDIEAEINRKLYQTPPLYKDDNQ